MNPILGSVADSQPPGRCSCVDSWHGWLWWPLLFSRLISTHQPPQGVNGWILFPYHCSRACDSSQVVSSQGLFFFFNWSYLLTKQFICVTLQASRPSLPPPRLRPPPGTPLPVSVTGAPMACTPTQLTAPPTSSASWETPTSTTASPVSFTGTPASAAIGLEAKVFGRKFAMLSQHLEQNSS